MKLVVHEDNTGFAPADCRFHAYDSDSYDADCDQDGFFSTSPVGYGRCPEEAVENWWLLQEKDDGDPYEEWRRDASEVEDNAL